MSRPEVREPRFDTRPRLAPDHEMPPIQSVSTPGLFSSGRVLELPSFVDRISFIDTDFPQLLPPHFHLQPPCSSRTTSLSLLPIQPQSVVKAAEGDVLTAVRIVQEMVDQEPFLIDVTSTSSVYSQGPSITPSATVEPIPDTIETGSVAAQA